MCISHNKLSKMSSKAKWIEMGKWFVLPVQLTLMNCHKLEHWEIRGNVSFLLCYKLFFRTKQVSVFLFFFLDTITYIRKDIHPVKEVKQSSSVLQTISYAKIFFLAGWIPGTLCTTQAIAQFGRGDLFFCPVPWRAASLGLLFNLGGKEKY